MIGSFTRSYGPFGVQRALKGISSAGLKYVGLMGFFPPTITGPQLAEISSLLKECNLKPIAVWGTSKGYDEEGTKEFRRIVDNSATLGINRVLIAGPWPYLEDIKVKKPTSRWMQEVEEFFRWVESILPYLEERDIKLALKPHAGITATAKECLETMERIGSEKVRIWYDPGNVVYYEGVRPEDVPDDLKVIVDYVDGMCLKDIVGGRGGELRVPGQGTIDFKELFAVLKEAGFRGPSLIEYGAPPGASAEDIDLALRKSSQYLRETLRKL